MKPKIIFKFISCIENWLAKSKSENSFIRLVPFKFEIVGKGLWFPWVELGAPAWTADAVTAGPRRLAWFSNNVEPNLTCAAIILHARRSREIDIGPNHNLRCCFFASKLSLHAGCNVKRWHGTRLCMVNINCIYSPFVTKMHISYANSIDWSYAWQCSIAAWQWFIRVYIVPQRKSSYTFKRT